MGVWGWGWGNLVTPPLWIARVIVAFLTLLTSLTSPYTACSVLSSSPSCVMHALRSRYLAPASSCRDTSAAWQRDQRSKKGPRTRGTGEKGPIPIDVETEYEPQLWEPGRARRERGRLLARGERRDIQVLKSGPDDEDSVAKRV